jgi:glc operon protein GlcG
MYVAESKRITHRGAKKIMTTAVDMANEAGIAISCAIVDAGGHMILLERMDGGRCHTVYSCTTKARTSTSAMRSVLRSPPDRSDGRPWKVVCRC